MSIRALLPVLTAVLAAGAAATAYGEVKVSCDTLPAAVLQQAKTEAPGAAIHGCVRDKENGKLMYEVETIQDGKSKDMTFDANGGLMEVEQQVDHESLPAAVSGAITKAANGADIGKVESVTRGGSVVSYETTITRKGKHKEVAFSPEGAPMKAD